MFESNLKKIDLNKKNVIISKTINLDKGLDCFILISSKDQKLWELLLNKIFDSIIDKIFHNNIHNKLWVALENINSFLYTWESNSEKIKWLHAVIWILRWNDVFFSTIWKPSCYLVNDRKEVVEITDKAESKKEFWFILNWSLKDGEVITFSNVRLFDYLSKDDLRDSTLSWDVNWFNNNIVNILKGEDLTKNVWVLSFQNLIFNISENKRVSEVLGGAMKLFDNGLTKKAVAMFMIAKEKLEMKSKPIKNTVFLLGIVVSFVLLYFILSSVIWLSQNDRVVDTSKQNLEQAKVYVRVASENTNNPEVFDLNIKKAEDLIDDIKGKQLFLNDIEKIQHEIGLLNKQFNQIESFEKTGENTIYTSPNLEWGMNVLTLNRKVYVIWKDFVVWPIIPWKDAEKYVFDKLADGDYFVDSVPMSSTSSIVLLTSLGNVVEFDKNSFFSYVDVRNQEKWWEDSVMLWFFSSNIYLLNKERNQIFKHKKEWETYSSWEKYLKDEDSTSIWEILSIAIDGWIYILKKDLSMVKLFRSPTYRLENMMLNKLPDNYKLEEGKNDMIKMEASQKLNYVYMLLNDRILIFEPNSNRYQNVKSLTFLGQVEWANFEIKDFYVESDWEIVVLWDSGLYKLYFEISEEDKLILK